MTVSRPEQHGGVSLTTIILLIDLSFGDRALESKFAREHFARVTNMGHKQLSRHLVWLMVGCPVRGGMSGKNDKATFYMALPRILYHSYYWWAAGGNRMRAGRHVGKSRIL
jgi:hypothetical protein